MSAVYRDEIIRPRNLPSIIGLSLTTIWRLQKNGDFPSTVQLSPRAVGFRLSEIMAWLEARQAA